MEVVKRHVESGVNPFHITQIYSAKEASNLESSDVPNSLLDRLSKFEIIQNDFVIDNSFIEQDFFLVDESS